MKKVLLAVLMMAPVSAFARGSSNSGWNTGLALMYQSSKSEVSGVSSESTQLDYDLKVGYLLSGGVYLGGIYQGRQTGGATSYPTRSGYGLVVGYHIDGWVFDLDYFLSHTHNADATNSYTGGTNLQLDIGYDFPVGQSFYVGWQLAYRVLSYTTGNPGSTTIDRKYTELQPLIRLGFNF